MTTENKSPVIAIEEHYLDPEVETYLGNLPSDGKTRDRLIDLGETRLREMDNNGIDIQVLSHCPPGAQAFASSEAAQLGRRVNDRLFDFISTKPDKRYLR